MKVFDISDDPQSILGHLMTTAMTRSWRDKVEQQGYLPEAADEQMERLYGDQWIAARESIWQQVDNEMENK